MHFRSGLAARAFLILAASILAAMPAVQAQTLAQDQIGVLLLHGKNPGNQNDPNLNQLKSKLDADGAITLLPDMPWSARRYIDGDWDKAMAEIDGHVKSLRSRGATRIVIVGHSMGCPTAMGYASKFGGVDGLALLAPGHAPYFYYHLMKDKSVHNSVNEARQMVAAGQGETRKDFQDMNQGRFQAVRTTAKAYLSYFDPATAAEMTNTAPQLKMPVIMVLGDQDPLFASARGTIFDKIPANAKSQYLEVAADHRTTPAVSREAVAAWIKTAVAP